MPVRWALSNPSNRKQVLLATEAGVWSTDDITVIPAKDIIWGFDPSSKIARTRIDMLRIRQSDKMVIAATHGRGLWTSSIFNPVAAFSVAPCTSVMSS